MIYRVIRDRLLRWLDVTPGAPDPPAGTHASVQVFRASPRFLRYRLIGLAVGGGVVLIVLSLVAVGTALAGERAGLFASLFAAVPVLAVLGLVYAGVRIDYEVRHYVVTDRSLRVREGAWTVREKTVSFANVQNLKVTQGPLQRAFGIADLRVETAGGGGGAGPHGTGGGGRALTVAGVEDAAEIRDLVGSYVRRHGDAGLGDPDDERPALHAPLAVGPASEGLRDALVQVLEEARRLRGVADDVGGAVG